MKNLLAALTFGLSAAAALGCGPYFPESYLAFETPRTGDFDLACHIKALAEHFHPDMPIVPKPAKNVSTAEGTRLDFLAAAAAAGLPERECPVALERYLAFCRQPSPEAVPSALPAKLREFYLYALGRNAVMTDPDDRCPEAWRELLSLPPELRHYRTTWVLYMLGNLQLNRAPEEAFRYYTRLREAAREGFADTIGLAWLSLRTNEKTPGPQALRYMVAAVAGGRTPDLWAFRRIAGKAAKENAKEALADPVVREVLLATSADPLPLLARLQPETKPLMAERLAARCYFDNRLDACRALLALCPENSLIRLYLEARLARREGDIPLAADKLSRWLRTYRAAGKTGLTFHPDEAKRLYAVDASAAGNSFPEEVNGVLGTILVEQQDFLEALHAFLAAGSWNDAAIVAEQLLPTDRLIEYCRNHASDPENARQARLRYLLARRLMREYRVEEAGAFFPEAMKPLYELYRTANRRANDPSLAEGERARALFQLGRLLRQRGFELRGTELEPDQFIVAGAHEELPSQNWRDGQFPLKTVGWYFSDLPRGPELINWSAPLPNLNRLARRFHYRRIAADFFARAGVLADDPALRAAAFWSAGYCLKDRHPDEANEYYLMLCDSGDAPMAAEARQLKWFPANPALERLVFKSPLEKEPGKEEIAEAASAKNGK